MTSIRDLVSYRVPITLPPGVDRSSISGPQGELREQLDALFDRLDDPQTQADQALADLIREVAEINPGGRVFINVYDDPEAFAAQFHISAYIDPTDGSLLDSYRPSIVALGQDGAILPNGQDLTLEEVLAHELYQIREGHFFLDGLSEEVQALRHRHDPQDDSRFRLGDRLALERETVAWVNENIRAPNGDIPRDGYGGGLPRDGWSSRADTGRDAAPRLSEDFDMARADSLEGLSERAARPETGARPLRFETSLG